MKKFLIVIAAICIQSILTLNNLDESTIMLNNDLLMNEMTQNQGHKTTLSKLQTEVLNRIKDPNSSYSSDGFINLNMMQKSLATTKFGDHFRFLRGPSSRPEPDEIMIEKLGRSNGVILYGNRRTVNFASDTSESPFVQREMQRIDLMETK